MTCCLKTTTDHKVKLQVRIWFSGEKVFRVQTSTNSRDDGVYANVAVKRHVPALCFCVVMSGWNWTATVSSLRKTSLVFVQPGAKVNSSYYCDVDLNEGLMPDIRKLSGNNFCLSARRCASSLFTTNVAFLRRYVPGFVEPENWLPNSPALNPVNYSIRGGSTSSLQQSVYGCRIVYETLSTWKKCCKPAGSRLVIGQDLIDRVRKRSFSCTNALSLSVSASGEQIGHYFD